MLSTPPAFILSQDQTLILKVCNPVHDSPSLANQSRFTVRSFLFKNVLQKILFRIFRVVLLFNLYLVFIVLVAVLHSLAPQQMILYNSFFILSTTFFKIYKNFKRRKRDLNPRAALTTYTLSRGTSSAT